MSNLVIKRRLFVPTRTFVRMWNAAESLNEVCVILELSLENASNRASILRSQGHELKYFERKGRRFPPKGRLERSLDAINAAMPKAKR